MIDWHSHILPALDDGSKDVEESLALLGSLSEQGVTCVVATPHFYANDESVEAFLERRQEAYEVLARSLPGGMPCIRLGAEVKYYQGISRMAELRRLCIDQTRVLLLEMPFCKWSEYTVKELLELANAPGISVMLAHVERYFFMQDKSVWRRLYERGILMQVNASVFLHFASRRRTLNFMKQGGVLFVGSDCHNTVDRPPRIGEAWEILKKKLDSGYCAQLREYGNSLLTKSSRRGNAVR